MTEEIKKDIKPLHPALEHMKDSSIGMTVVIAGGRGFIGHNMVIRLLAHTSFNIVVLDDKSTGFNEHWSNRVKYFPCDIRNMLEVQRAVQTLAKLPHIEVEFLFNLACPASPPNYQKDPIGTIFTNALGTSNLCAMARQLSCVLVQASTSEVYGDPQAPYLESQPETYYGNVNNLGPRACYDNGKRIAETIVAEYHRSAGLDAKIARIFNTYGPHMNPDDGRVVSNFICQALNKQPMTIYGDGSQTRSFCYVDDLIDGLLLLAYSDLPAVVPVNLGRPVNFTIRQLAELIHDEHGGLGDQLNIDPRPMPADDPKVRNPDITLAKKYLDWEPQVSLEEGIEKTFVYFAELLGKVD